jgi:hypothetical protein
MKRTKASEAKRRIVQTEQARRGQVKELLAADAMVAGSFVTLARGCGKATCRCARGEKHQGKYLSRSEGGRTRLVYVPAGDEVEVATRAERYRRFREARAVLMKLAAETAQAADALQIVLTQPYPKEARRRRKRR